MKMERKREEIGVWKAKWNSQDPSFHEFDDKREKWMFGVHCKIQVIKKEK